MSLGPLLELAEDMLAVHRLTRLATLDEITRPWREQLIERSYVHHRWVRDDGVVVERHLPEHEGPGGWETAVEVDGLGAPRLATLITCRWCASVWVALAVVVVRRRRWWRPVGRLLALSSASTLLAGLEDR